MEYPRRYRLSTWSNQAGSFTIRSAETRSVCIDGSSVEANGEDCTCSDNCSVRQRGSSRKRLRSNSPIVGGAVKAARSTLRTVTNACKRHHVDMQALQGSSSMLRQLGWTDYRPQRPAKQVQGCVQKLHGKVGVIGGRTTRQIVDAYRMAKGLSDVGARDVGHMDKVANRVTGRAATCPRRWSILISRCRCGTLRPINNPDCTALHSAAQLANPTGFHRWGWTLLHIRSLFAAHDLVFHAGSLSSPFFSTSAFPTWRPPSHHPAPLLHS